MRSTLIIFSSLILLSCSMLTLSDTSKQLYFERFESADESVSMKSSTINELSGLASSRAHPSLFWAHNDSGDQARIFLINPSTGVIRLEVALQGIKNVDFEDITMQTVGEQSYVIVGDIGDNSGHRPLVSLHRIKEPKSLNKKNIVIPKSKISTMNIKYAEGARDAETLMSDTHGDLIIVTKREDSNYIYGFEFEPGKTKTLTSKGRIEINNLTAGDINRDGEIVLRNYAQIFYWPASEQPANLRLTSEKPLGIPTAPEPQGEAIAWSNEFGLYSIPEKPFMFEQVIFHYASKTGSSNKPKEKTETTNATIN